MAAQGWDGHLSAGGEQSYCASHMLLGFSFFLSYSIISNNNIIILTKIIIFFTLLELLICSYLNPQFVPFFFSYSAPHLTRVGRIKE